MKQEAKDLYQELILDHYKNPRNCRHLECASHCAKGANPSCGDQVSIYLQIEDGIVKEATFEGSGCAISTASASLMTEAVKGKKAEEVEKLFQEFHHLITSESSEQNSLSKLGKLSVFQGIRNFPLRIKCASLAWHTMKSALDKKKNPSSTE